MKENDFFLFKSRGSAFHNFIRAYEGKHFKLAFFRTGNSNVRDLPKLLSFLKKFSNESGSKLFTYLYMKQPWFKLIKSVNFRILVLMKAAPV